MCCHKCVKDSIQCFGLCCDNFSSFSADNTKMNCGKKKFLQQRLLNDSDTTVKVNCNAHS
jgi:hypothetical protein